MELSAVWKEFVSPQHEYEGDRIEWLDLSSGPSAAQDAYKFQLKFVEKMILGDGIALNEALRENLFMLLVSVMNHVPIFVIGKPGCSKSLAVEILQRNLNGVASEEPLFKSLPALQVMAYQCSPLSTASGLLNQFNNARKYAGQDRSTTIVCVLLDEVGLAEESPHLPLKVLHKELEQLDGISCIGISNWSLDAAKMSRAVTLFRPPPTVDDLCQTAKDMVSNHVVRAYLPALSRGFYDVYQGQKRSDFWGLREFYSIVRVINCELKRQQLADANSTPKLDATTLMNTVCRNFGGRTATETDDIVDVFFSHCGLRKDDATRLTVRQLILRNLEEPDARHLMLLTQNNSALRLLFDAAICQWETTEVLFGSSFTDDQSDMSVATNLNKIKSWMQRPMSLILVQCDSLYESLYDLLNQHYVELAGQRYVRIAHGSSSKECPIHHLFRIIVIVEKWDAWTTLAPPLLNRFEKQVFVRSAMCEVDMHFELLELVTQYLQAIVDDYFCEEEKDDGFSERAQRIIVGYHADLLPSLVVSLDLEHRERDELFGEAMRRIIWVMSPECVTALAAKSGALRLNQFSDKANHLWPSLHKEYFSEQAHEDLRDFTAFVEQNEHMWTDRCGGQYIVTTFTPIGANVVETLMALPSHPEVDHITLHDFKAGADFEQRVDAFYGKQCDEGILLVQADVWASPVRQLEFCRYTCERKRRDWMARGAHSKRFVILVVHLVRGERTFSFEFDRRWRTVFVDAIAGANTLGLPPLSEMLHQPLGEAMKKVHLRQVLSSQVLRPSLAQLIYPTKRTSADLTHQIHVLLQYIHNDAFMQCVSGILSVIFEEFDANLKKVLEKMKQKAIDAHETFSGSQYEWHVIAQTPERMRRAGTFRAALHSRLLEIMQALISRLLAWFDRNAQLELFERGGAIRKIWLDMAHYSVLSSTIKESLLSCLSQDDPHSLQEVISDSVSDPFVAKFPFSFTIVARIAELRAELASNLDDDSTIATVSEVLARLAKQWQLSQIPLDPNFISNGIAQNDYVSDFVMMRLQRSRLAHAQQQQLVVALCRKSLGLQAHDDLRSIFDVHVGYWLNQKRMFNLNNVLSAVPCAIDEVLRTIADHTATPDHTMDVHLMNNIIQAHMNVLMNMTDENDQLQGPDGTNVTQWCKDARVVSYMADSIVRVPTAAHDALGQLQESMYPVLLLSYHFVRDVIQPLELSISILHETLRKLPPKVRSIGSCRILLDAFERVIEVLPKKKTSEALTTCSIVLEWFILNLCVPDAATLETREVDLLKLLVRTCGGSMWAKVGNEIVPRPAPPKMEYQMSFCELSGSNKVSRRARKKCFVPGYAPSPNTHLKIIGYKNADLHAFHITEGTILADAIS